MRYEVIQTQDEIFRLPAFELRDNLARSSAVILPALGFNLMSFVIDSHGRPQQVIMGAPAGTACADAWRWGNPILFPFPNRVRGGRYVFDGVEHRLDVNTSEGHHLHGLVHSLVWKVVNAEPMDPGALIRGSISFEDYPELLRQYPFPCVLSVSYLLRGNELRCDLDLINTGSGSMPAGLGIHPYFLAPLEPSGERGRCLITVPARRIWRLDGQKLPTGVREDVPAELDFRHPRPLGCMYLDHSYTGLIQRENQVTCTLMDPGSAVELSVRFGPEFPELVVLAPADRNTVSFEPYTSVTDAVNLAASVNNTGLLVLAPNTRWRGTTHLSARVLR